MKTSSTLVIEEWRDLWSYKGDFVIVCFVYVFSWSTALAFPKLFVENGGGAFGVAYLASMIVCSLPIVMIELAIGQLCAKSPPKTMFTVSPVFAGVGGSQVIYSLVKSSVLVAYAGYLISFMVHIFMSIDSGRPSWASCSNEDWTFQPLAAEEVVNLPANRTLPSIYEYFRSAVLNATDDVEQTGQLQWMLISASAIVWLLIFLALFYGVRWLGKVCYFTFVIPLLIALTLLVKSLSSEGASAMLQRTFNTDWNALYKTETWMRALSESMHGFGLGYGAYITLGSFNKRSNNIVGDTFLIVFIHLVASSLSMVFITALLGHLVFRCHLSYEIILHDGLFQMFNLLEAVGNYEHPYLWSGFLLTFFIFLLFNLMCVFVLNIQTAIEDAVGNSASTLFARAAISLAVCAVGFVITLGYNAQSGLAASQMVFKYTDLICPWTIVALELIAICWIYCAHNLAVDIGQLIRNRCSKVILYIFLQLGYFLPAAPIYVMVIKVQLYLASSEKEAAGMWTEIIGWTLAIFILLPIPICFAYRSIMTCVRGTEFSFGERMKYAFMSPLRYEVPKAGPSSSRYTSTLPGYTLLSQAPLAEPELYNDMYGGRSVAMSNA